MLANTEALLFKLTAVHTTKMLMDVYKDTTLVLNAASNAAGLTPEAVSKVLDDLADVVDAHEEVALAVSGGSSSSTLEEQAELEAEFAALFEPEPGVFALDCVGMHLVNACLHLQPFIRRQVPWLATALQSQQLHSPHPLRPRTQQLLKLITALLLREKWNLHSLRLNNGFFWGFCTQCCLLNRRYSSGT